MYCNVYVVWWGTLWLCQNSYWSHSHKTVRESSHFWHGDESIVMLVYRRACMCMFASRLHCRYVLIKVLVLILSCAKHSIWICIVHMLCFYLQSQWPENLLGYMFHSITTWFCRHPIVQWSEHIKSYITFLIIIAINSILYPIIHRV